VMEVAPPFWFEGGHPKGGGGGGTLYTGLFFLEGSGPALVWTASLNYVEVQYFNVCRMQGPLTGADAS
jgi:hypothetical protein